MARAIPPTNLTPADELRVLLERLERRLPNLRGTGESTIELLGWMDRIHVLVPELREMGVDLRAEMSRLETIEATLEDRAGVLAREAGSKLARARVEAEATPERWWWYVNEIARRRRIQQLKRAGLYGAIAVAIVFFVAVVIPRIFPVDPGVAAAQRFTQQAENAMQEGDFETALAAYRSAAEALPDDPSYPVRAGVLAETLGYTSEAEAAYATARLLTEDDVQFYAIRSQAYLLLGNVEAALADADHAVAINSESVEGHFQRASALEMSGRLSEAIDEFEIAATLAEESSPQLAVLARVRMGYLIQSMPIRPSTETPTPAP